MVMNREDEELIYHIAEQLTGSCQQGIYRKDVIARNIGRRIQNRNCKSLKEYLQLVEKDSSEFEKMISEMTIHTTSWFREDPHFDYIKKDIANRFENKKNFLAWSAACSTGEEVYSLALIFEELKTKLGNFNYVIEGSDIDPVSVSKAQKAIYKSDELKNIPKQFHPYLLSGTKKASGLFTIDKQIRQRCRFDVRNLTALSLAKEAYDIIMCRNVLIYFDKKKQDEIIEQLISALDHDGLLILGHSDSFPTTQKIKSINNSIFKKVGVRPKARPSQATTAEKTVLIVDDSPTVRKSLGKLLAKKFSVSDCESAEDAERILSQKKFDLITLDLNMSGENGAVWLQKKRQNGFNTPVVIVSDSSPSDADKVFGALSSGAQDYIVKSRLHNEQEEILNLLETLATKKEQSTDKNQLAAFDAKNFSPQAILIGASTGGPEALVNLLTDLPKNLPPIVIVQHISYEFSETFARRIMNVSGLPWKKIDSSTPLEKGHIYMSAGDYHLEITERNKILHVKPSTAAKEQGHRPSVDFLFKTAAKTGGDFLAILMTGMGKDGADGMGDLHKSGRTYTLAQDSASCVVYGMPKKAIESGSVCFIGNINQLRKEFIARCTKEEKTAA